MCRVWLVAICYPRNDRRGHPAQFLSQKTVEEEKKRAGVFASVPFPVSLKWTHWCCCVRAGEGHRWCLLWCEVTPCLSYGGGEVGLGDVVTGLQGLKNTWIKHRQECLILSDLCEKEKQFFVCQEKPSVAMETVGGKGKWGNGWKRRCVVMGLPLGKVPEQELRGSPVALVPSVYFLRHGLYMANPTGVEFRCP